MKSKDLDLTQFVPWAMMHIQRRRVVFHYILFIFSAIFTGKSQPCSVPKRIVASRDRLESINISSNSAHDNSDGCPVILDSGRHDHQLFISVSFKIPCIKNKFYIYDGQDDKSIPLADNQCGQIANPKLFSTSQRFAYIKVVTESGVEFDINLLFIAASDSSGVGCKSQQTLEVTDSYQYLSTQNFPVEYKSDSNCRWLIVNPSGLVDVELIVVDVEDDEPDSCEYDKIQIFDGEYKCENNVLKTMCTEFPDIAPHNITSTGTALLITFESDDSVNRRGLYMRYKGRHFPTTSRKPTTSKSTTLRLIELDSTSTTEKVTRPLGLDSTSATKRETDPSGHDSTSTTKREADPSEHDSTSITKRETDPSEHDSTSTTEREMHPSRQQFFFSRTSHSGSPTKGTTTESFNKNKANYQDKDFDPEIIYGIAGGGVLFIAFVVTIVIVIIKNLRFPKLKCASKPSPSLTTTTDSVSSRRSPSCNSNPNDHKHYEKDDLPSVSGSLHSDYKCDNSSSSLELKHNKLKIDDPPYATVIRKHQDYS